MVQKHIRSSTKKMVWAGAVSGLLIAFCCFVFYTGSAQAFSSETPTLTPIVMTPTVKPTPLVIVVNSPSTTQSNPQDDFVVTILIALLSCSVGAIIGSIIQARINNKGLMAATEKQTQSLFQATEHQIKSLYEQEKENRQYAEKRQQETIGNALMVELNENSVLLSSSERNLPLISEAWSLYKGNIAAFSPALQEELIVTYSAMKKYNSILEQISSMYHQKMDNNLLFPLQAEQNAKVRTLVQSVLKQLSQE